MAVPILTDFGSAAKSSLVLRASGAPALGAFSSIVQSSSVPHPFRGFSKKKCEKGGKARIPLYTKSENASEVLFINAVIPSEA
jgi:hypothetical protein